jgi:hypothetical protein
MKIGIDISLTIGEKAGVGYYSTNLVDALAKIDKTNQYLLYPFFYHIYQLYHLIIIFTCAVKKCQKK